MGDFKDITRKLKSITNTITTYGSPVSIYVGIYIYKYTEMIGRLPPRLIS